MKPCSGLELLGGKILTPQNSWIFLNYFSNLYNHPIDLQPKDL